MSYLVWNRIAKCLQAFPLWAVMVHDVQYEIQASDVDHLQLVRIRLEKQEIPPVELEKGLRLEAKEASTALAIPEMKQVQDWEVESWMKFVDSCPEEEVSIHNQQYSKALLRQWNVQASGVFDQLSVGDCTSVLTLKYSLANAEGKSVGNFFYHLAPADD